MIDNTDWIEIYRGGKEEIPWDIGVASDGLIKAVTKGEIKPCRALDVGCGTATEAIYLAMKGFNVFAIDFSYTAIRIAREKTSGSGETVNLAVASLPQIPFQNDSFDFVNDRGCFHIFSPEHREAFALEIQRVMRNRGVYMMKCFSEKEPKRDGPFRISEKEIRRVFSIFKIIRIDDITLHGKNVSHKGYECIFKKKI